MRASDLWGLVAISVLSCATPSRQGGSAEVVIAPTQPVATNATAPVETAPVATTPPPTAATATTPQPSEDLGCSADWQCPHGNTCQAGACVAAGAAIAGGASGGGSSGGASGTTVAHGGGTASGGGGAHGGAANAHGGANGGGANGGGANGGGANGGGANGGGANGGGANGGGANGGGANGGGANGGGANGGGANGGGANGGGANGGGANGGGANGGGANGGGANGGGANGGGANGGGANGGGANGGGANGGGANGGGANGGGANGGGANGWGTSGGWGGGVASASGPNEPYSIDYDVYDGMNSVTDDEHAMYRPTHTLHLRAIIRNANGEIINNGCHPIFDIADNLAPNGAARGFLDQNGDIGVIQFGRATGVFTVGVHCQENPEITSHGHGHAPLNFETSTSRFARCVGCSCNETCPLKDAGPVANNVSKPGMSHGTKVALVGAVAAGLVLAVVVASNAGADTGGGGACYCINVTSSDNGSCPAGQYPYATQNDCLNGPMGLAFIENFCQCHVAQCTVVFAPNQCDSCACPASRTQQVGNVPELVARGLAQQRAAGTRGAVRAHTPNLGDTHVRALAAAQPAASHLGAWVSGSLAAVSLAATAYVLWTRLHPHHVDVTPYVSPDGGGVTVLGRF